MGVLCGELDALIEARVPELFMACGLGHFIGLDTHDVGGYPRGVQRVDEPGIKALRYAHQPCALWRFVLPSQSCLRPETGQRGCWRRAWC